MAQELMMNKLFAFGCVYRKVTILERFEDSNV